MEGLPFLAQAAATSGNIDLKTIEDSLKIMLLVRSYQVRGHTQAKTDPLGMSKPRVFPELLPETYGFTEADMDREFYIPMNPGLISGFLSGNKPKRTLREIMEKLKQTYCSNIGVEFMHIQNRDENNWIKEHFETERKYSFSKEDKLLILDRLAWATFFERFLGVKMTTQKRFGLDGCEALIPGMKAMIDTAADIGIESIVIGMAHRGRLNVLGNVVRKPLEVLLYEFEKGAVIYDEWASGDVKYHLGTSYDRPTRSGKKVHLSLLANPSHLEAVDPVVEGKTRAKQYYGGDVERSKSMAVQLHGDASFAGQGVVWETLNFAGVPDYTTGGTVHIVINNQVGFTTNPQNSRGGLYCTDIAKSIGAPIFHVNADDPEAVVHACQLAAEWRQKFKKSVVIDLICYRRFGHNEQDQPKFTQPLMYKNIDQHKATLDYYFERLANEGLTNADAFAQMKEQINASLNQAFEASKSYHPKATDWLESKWKDFKSPKQTARIKNTGVPLPVLKQVGEIITSVPEGFTPHAQLTRLLTAKKQMFQTGKGIDWGTAEALAFGTLLLEGNHVRLAGQDCQRGTFSHRHAVLHDQNSGQTWFPLQNLPGAKASIDIVNSTLSEFGVLGFELGYSLESPNALVIWEAQFGDFSNGAQVIIDQFLSSGEKKWYRQSGLVMLLPHGYEGAGPEHSSSRMERYLQLCDSDPDHFPGEEELALLDQTANWQVCNVTTPANYFHLLRRQIHREFRKPLVITTPKSLLKHPEAKSDLDQFDDIGDDVRFQPMIPETDTDMVADDKIRKLLLCSGKVYYELHQHRNTVLKDKSVAIVRVEQLHPFPWTQMAQTIAKYPNAEVCWVQEEPKNMGAWSFIYFHIKTAGRKVRGDKFEPQYAGRASAASPATASYDRHKMEIEQFMAQAFGK
eukprot:TRINITY_DN309_c0_g1_i1.p1 TRINITY_DN309_c0_g1~~TRINITY_DN309_c0_g1_i1.p1  ORF type:complete len:1036 (+),score=285.46 TRINITY_DN309_c0_g1_i1:380-3109(+)